MSKLTSDQAKEFAMLGMDAEDAGVEFAQYVYLKGYDRITELEQEIYDAEVKLSHKAEIEITSRVDGLIDYINDNLRP